jgi:Mrp family chromosome partitioning ATPase
LPAALLVPSLAVESHQSLHDITLSKSQGTFMSCNFELLNQIELDRQLGRTDHTARTTANQVIEETFSGSATSDAGEPCGEEMQRLVRSIFLSPNERVQRRVVVFCGVDAETGSSSVCADAGRALRANSSHSVCLVDANVRSPRLSGIFDVDEALPFSGRSLSAREQCKQVAGNLWLAGTEMLTDDRGSLQSADKLRLLIAELRSMFEYLLIDVPGINVCGDAQLLGQMADATVLVVEANSTRKRSARKAKESLDAAGVRLLGTVLHNRSFPIPESLYKRL